MQQYVPYSRKDSISENEELVIAIDSCCNYVLKITDFTYYKSDISEKLLAEKLNTIFEYYNSKNIVNKDLINILIGEISGNHTTFDLFKNENNSNNNKKLSTSITF